MKCLLGKLSLMDVRYQPEFLGAVEPLLRDEGGYVRNPDDPGGETKFGISKREYPDLNIAALTREQAIAIYWRDYWHRYGLDRLHDKQIAAKLLDLAVNIGPDHAIKCLQRALRACQVNVAEDGVLGLVTVAAANMSTDPRALLVGLRCEAAGYYRTLAALERGRRDDGDRDFLEGWLNRAYA